CMRAYVIKRLLLFIPTLLGVSILVFALIRMLPGDAALTKLEATSDAAAIAKARAQLGLDRPAYRQYVTWAGHALRGDFGTSFWTGRSVLGMLGSAFPVTLELAFLACLFAVCLALPLGIVAALTRGSWIDQGIRLLATLGLALPAFWIATLAILLPSLYLGWLAPIGYVSLLEDPAKHLQQILIPAAVLGFALSATTMRMTRSQMLEVLRQDYVRTAWAKGLRGRSVVVRHALKNALIPVLTIVGNQLGALLGGTVIIESIFSLPGLGRLTLDAVTQRDYPL